MKSGAEGAAVTGITGAMAGSVAPGIGTTAGGIVGVATGAVGGSGLHMLGCIW